MENKLIRNTHLAGQDGAVNPKPSAGITRTVLDVLQEGKESRSLFLNSS